MRGLEFLLVLTFNFTVIIILYRFQRRMIEKNIKRLKEEVQELEDLVAAIIEEFEEIASTAENKEKSAVEFGPGLEPGLNYPTVDDFLDNLEENEFETGKQGQKSGQTTATVPGETGAQELAGISTEEAGPASKNSGPIKLESVKDLRHRRILELREQGITVEDIARQLGTGRGEIQLVLGLYRRS